MKKTKILLPLVSLAATIGVVTPLVTLASCNKESEPEPVVTPDTLNIDDDGVLLGFKEGTTDEDIQKQFGNTLLIPKEVKSIAEKAFVHDQYYSTIPDFIENFEFENEYNCTEIGRGAFKFAPFKNITITCQRNAPDGQEHPATWFYLPENGWGLKTIGSNAFFQNTRLESVKLAATINGFGSDTFSCFDGDDYFLTLKTIDMSDWAYGDRPSVPDLSYPFHMGSREEWSGKMIIRGFDGIYGPKLTMGDGAKKLQFLNSWQERWGGGYISSDWGDESEWKLNNSGTSTIEWWGNPNPQY